MDLQALYNQATAAHRQGDLAGAEQACLRLLSVEPDKLQIRPLMCCTHSKAAPVAIIGPDMPD